MFFGIEISTAAPPKCSFSLILVPQFHKLDSQPCPLPAVFQVHLKRYTPVVNMYKACSGHGLSIWLVLDGRYDGFVFRSTTGPSLEDDAEC